MLTKYGCHATNYNTWISVKEKRRRKIMLLTRLEKMFLTFYLPTFFLTRECLPFYNMTFGKWMSHWHARLLLRQSTGEVQTAYLGILQ